MDSIREYLITILTSALISAIIMRISGKCGISFNIIKLILAVFLSINIVAPILKLEINDLCDIAGEFDTDAQAIIDDAKSTAVEETAAVIIKRTEEYIEEKAALFNATITATVSISNLDTLTPDSVVISGNISPYGKISLEKIIKDDLGIPEDRQTWN